jgi:hypothetical protein
MQAAGTEASLLQDRLDRVREVELDQLPGGQVDAQHQRRVARELILPAARVRAGALQHPAPKRDDEAAAP